MLRFTLVLGVLRHLAWLRRDFGGTSSDLSVSCQPQLCFRWEIFERDFFTPASGRVLALCNTWQLSLVTEWRISWSDTSVERSHFPSSQSHHPSAYGECGLAKSDVIERIFIFGGSLPFLVNILTRPPEDLFRVKHFVSISNIFRQKRNCRNCWKRLSQIVIKS